MGYLNAELYKKIWVLLLPITTPTFCSHQHQSAQGSTCTVTFSSFLPALPQQKLS